jgi:type I restriction enzyme, S subunit
MTTGDLITAFAVVAEAPDGVARLQELVLELAVRGRLVPQDPTDEPASVLAERITAEKARMVRDGETRKQEPILPVREDEVPFSVPKAWCWTRFDSVADTRLGKMLDKAKNQGPLRPYLRNANVQWFRFELGDVLQLRVEDDQLSDCTVRDGDLVICEGGEPGRAAVCGPEVDGMVIQKALHRARPRCGISAWYLGYLLRCDALSGRLAQRFTGATIKHLTGKALAQCVVPLPPLAEQRRIVARVGELMALLDQLEAARTARDATRAAARDSVLAALREADESDEVKTAWNRFAERMDDLLCEPADIPPLRQSILQLAVRGRLVQQDPADEPASVLLERVAAEKVRLKRAGKIPKQQPLAPVRQQTVPFAVPKGWEWTRIEDLSALVTDGVHKTPNYVSEGVPFLSIKDISAGFIDFSHTRFITKAEHVELNKRCNPEKGDILFCRIGTLGKAVVVDTEKPFSLFVSVGLIKLTQQLSSNFLCMALNSPATQAQYENIKAGGSHTEKLNLGPMRAAILPLPPLAEQHRIVERVGQLMGLLDRFEERLAAARATNVAFAAAAVHNLEA